MEVHFSKHTARIGCRWYDVGFDLAGKAVHQVRRVHLYNVLIVGVTYSLIPDERGGG